MAEIEQGKEGIGCSRRQAQKVEHLIFRTSAGAITADGSDREKKDGLHGNYVRKPRQTVGNGGTQS